MRSCNYTYECSCSDTVIRKPVVIVTCACVVVVTGTRVVVATRTLVFVITRTCVLSWLWKVVDIYTRFVLHV